MVPGNQWSWDDANKASNEFELKVLEKTWKQIEEAVDQLPEIRGLYLFFDVDHPCPFPV